MILIPYLLLGIAAGTLSGLLGVGGGLIVVPALVILFKSYAVFNLDQIMHMAVGTSLAVMMATTSSSAWAYQRQGWVVWSLFWRFIPGLCVGMILGSLITQYLKNDLLVWLFCIFLVVVALKLLFERKDKPLKNPSNQPQQPMIFIGLVSLMVGILSTLFGIGGGLLMVPFFLALQYNIRKSSGTSSMCGLPVAIVGTLLLARVDVNHVGTTGYVYWPAALAIATTSVFFAPLGTYLAGHLQTKTLKRLFALLLLISACNLMW